MSPTTLQSLGESPNQQENPKFQTADEGKLQIGQDLHAREDGRYIMVPINRGVAPDTGKDQEAWETQEETHEDTQVASDSDAP